MRLFEEACNTGKKSCDNTIVLLRYADKKLTEISRDYTWSTDISIPEEIFMEYYDMKNTETEEFHELTTIAIEQILESARRVISSELLLHGETSTFKEREEIDEL